MENKGKEYKCATQILLKTGMKINIHASMSLTYSFTIPDKCTNVQFLILNVQSF